MHLYRKNKWLESNDQEIMEENELKSIGHISGISFMDFRVTCRSNNFLYDGKNDNNKITNIEIE